MIPDDILRLLIPSISIMEEHHQKYVYVAQDGKALRKVVEAGFVNGELTEIKNGLEGDEQIIVRGQRNLRDDQPIKVLPDEPSDQDAQEVAAQ